MPLFLPPTWTQRPPEPEQYTPEHSAQYIARLATPCPFTIGEILTAFDGLVTIAGECEPSEWIDEDLAEYTKAVDMLRALKGGR